ncbi:CbtB domain-containing protein [Oceanibium sediminis]|uniref:CbtB domain-containing protein n=1 Tax=Oceanibium sediminis TaxID=2026339 RepID=UPI000DD3A2AE|nr:CbtB domain-containing protein [Oceanibium sediminis]
MTTLIKAGRRVDADVQAILVTLVLGAALLWTAGFANSAALHTAAHDSRHSITFPCH